MSIVDSYEARNETPRSTPPTRPFEADRREGTLFGVGPNYLVMELIEGPTLGDRIHEGAIPLEEALGIARQIADALEAAHEKGIVHRDLKPGNVKIRPDGSVKVLDFGLAKDVFSESQISGDSPTLMHLPTQMGLILGTAAYMAPEQARGKVVDKRADIWSFGVVLHEMLTGKRLFEGEDLTETLASVVKSEPDLSPVPLQVKRLLAKCLQRAQEAVAGYWGCLGTAGKWRDCQSRADSQFAPQGLDCGGTGDRSGSGRHRHAPAAARSTRCRRQPLQRAIRPRRHAVRQS
ncbi:MAG: serine/threonine protein kinase [Bryobacteraceae bacterium]|nr:serine/threonine protein kinase [Bryobacteraceae bacterium]